MATLEKIRSKSVFLIVIIGVALLAFIVGDALTNSRNLFGDHTVVAKVGKEKIDYPEYQRKREEVNNRLEQARRQNPQQYANFDTQLLSQIALEELVSEKLLDAGVERAGIRTSPSQLRYYVIDNPVNPTLNTLMQQLNASGLNVSTPQQAYEVVFNPTRHGVTEAQMAPFQRAWIAMEEETKKLVARQTYQKLLYNSVKANDLDKRAIYNDYVNTMNVDVAYKPFGQISESKYPVSEQELNAAYAECKGQFKVLEPTKDVSFISVRVTPSETDRAAAKALADQTVKTLADSASQLSRQARREGVSLDHREVLASSLPAGELKNYLASAPADSVKLIRNDLRGFQAVRMGRRFQTRDSIQLNLVQVVGATLPSKVLATLNAGSLSVDSINTKFSPDSVFAQKEQWIVLFNKDGRTGAIEESQLDTLVNANGRFVEIMSNQQGAVLAQVSRLGAMKEAYEFDEVNYSLVPSTKTVNEARAQLEKFLADNNTAKAFNANAAKAGYSIEDLSLSSSAPAVPRAAGMQVYYPESRQVVRWVMVDAEPGQVSHIYESKDASQPMLYAVAVNSEYDDFMPVSNKTVKTYLTGKVRNSKAGDDMIKQYKGKTQSVGNVAAAMGVEPRNNDKFRFGRGASVRDAKVIGMISGSRPSKTVRLVKGDDGVYAFVVNATSKESFPYTDRQYEQQYFQLVNPDLNGMVRGSDRIDNRIYKFEAGD